MSAIEAPENTNEDQQQAIESPDNTELASQAKDLEPQLSHISVVYVHAHYAQRRLTQPPSRS